MSMKFRETWHVDDDGDKVCIWCGRYASLCVIENPCVAREGYEWVMKISTKLLTTNAT
jgi:hypothetical protein